MSRMPIGPAVALCASICFYGCATQVAPEQREGRPSATTGGGEAGVGGAGGETGQGGAPLPTGCGDGLAVEANEECDGEHLRGESCESLGFDGGVLGCKPDCTLDVTACIGSEDCADGFDNDADGAIDCEDPVCQVVCEANCVGTHEIPDPGGVQGSTLGHPSVSAPGCLLAEKLTGPQLEYGFTATVDGVIDAHVTSYKDVGIAVQSECVDPSTRIACADHTAEPGGSERVVVPVSKGESVTLVVFAASSSEGGLFELSAESRAIVCGDGHQDPTERCDDGNAMGDDGCSSACQVESTEAEPNDSYTHADALTSPWFGEIAPAGDEDYVLITLDDGPSTLTVDTVAMTGDCADGALATAFELADMSGTVLAFADGGGLGLCASLTQGNLAAGTYFLRVFASDNAIEVVFPYALSVVITP